MLLNPLKNNSVLVVKENYIKNVGDLESLLTVDLDLLVIQTWYNLFVLYTLLLFSETFLLF